MSPQPKLHFTDNPGWRLLTLLCLPILAGIAAPLPALAVTYSALLKDPQMNPKRFAGTSPVSDMNITRPFSPWMRF